MSEPFARLRRFLRELKRRNVYKVAVGYLAVAFVGLQAARLLVPATTLPEWADQLFIFLAVAGFPLALVIAWAFEVTPEGIQRTPGAEGASGPESMSPEERRDQSRLAMKALVGLGLVGAAVTGGWYLMGGGGESPEVSEQTVAVLPFQVSGSGTEEWREGMVTMLGTGLDGAAGLRAIADQTVLAAWEQAGEASGPSGAPRFLSAARRIGARYAVVGSAVKLGGELRLSADVHDAPSGDRLGQVEVRGSPERVTALTDSLTRQVLAVLLERSGQDLPSVDLARLTTSSLPALKSFLRGERHFRASEFEAAVEDYEAAVAEDSTFALAYARLGRSHGWSVNLDRSHRNWSRAYALSDRLPDRERSLVRGTYLYNVANRHLRAADTLRRLTEEYPDDPGVWYSLGEVVFHQAVPRGKPEADQAFGRAVDLDPGMAPYHHHYIELAVSVHRDSALAARRLAAYPGEDVMRYLETGLELVWGSRERRDEILATSDTLPTFHLQHPVDARLWTAHVEKDLLPPRFYLWWRPAGAYLRQGQVQEAVARIKQRSGSASDRACLLAYASTWAMPVPDALARRYLEPSNLPEDASSHRLKCTGLYLVDRGRGDELPEIVRRLRSATDTLVEQLPPLAQPRETLVDEVRGYRAYRAGDLKRAARLWAEANKSDHWGAVWRGDLYRQRGQLETAEGWYFAAWPMPLAHQRLGQLYEEMDQPDKAAAAYRRFVAAWEDADPELQDRVEEARKRLQELKGSPPQTDE